MQICKNKYAVGLKTFITPALKLLIFWYANCFSEDNPIKDFHNLQSKRVT